MFKLEMEITASTMTPAMQSNWEKMGTGPIL